MKNRLATAYNRIFGIRFRHAKYIAAVVFMLAACLSTLGMMTLGGMMDTSEYAVKGLVVKQQDTKLNVSWQPQEGCTEYEVFLQQNLKKPKSMDVKGTSCVLELDKLDQRYKVTVTAKVEGTEGNAGASAKRVYARKVKQHIGTAKEKFAGFQGNKAEVQANAKGDIAYSSSDEEVVEVQEDGTLEYKNPGKAQISIKAEEGDQYREGQKVVPVTVYPETLETPALTANILSNAEAALTWEPVAFAQGYILQKRNPATGEYADVEEVDSKTTTIKVPRDQAQYRIKAFASLEGETVESESSKDEEVKSAAETAETYGSFENLRTLDHSSLEVVAEVNGLGGATVPQSMSYINGNYVICYANHSGSQGAMVAYNEEGERVAEGGVSGMGHANGSTYNPNTGKIYTVKTHKLIRSNQCTAFYAEDFSSAGSFDLPKTTSGIAYDESNDKYYLSKGNEIYVVDSEFEKAEHFYWKKIRYNHAQDIGAYNGVALVCTWVNGNESYIDMYRVSDGEYIGGYSVPIGEIESVLVVDKHLVILMNNTDGGRTDHILRTIDPIEIP